jgi:protein-disulfide isomerase
MTSGKKARQQRRTPAPPPVRSTGARKASPKVLAIGAGLIALAAVAVVLAVVLSNGGSSNPATTNASTLPDAGAALAIFRGIPQNGAVLGSPKARAEIVEYIDLQCPVCRDFETNVMPTIITRYVRTGKVKVIARPIAALGGDSGRGQLAALAAARQNHLFDFAQLLYFNQGEENTGWLNDDIIRSAYASIPGFDSATALALRNSSSITDEADRMNAEATALPVRFTPTVLAGKSGGKLELVAESEPDVATMQAALEKALR